MITAEEIRQDLRAHDVVNAYHLRIARRGKWWRLKECPRCGETSSSLAIAIDPETGAWLHHGHERAAGGECSGDILDLVAALEGLDCLRNFPAVVRRAAEIAGLDTERDPATKERRYREAIARARQADREERQRLNNARHVADRRWSQLAIRSPHGEAYLESRGLNAAELVEHGCVRFTPQGDVVVALHDVDGDPVGESGLTRQPHGHLVSTATRLLDPGDGPKVMALRDCPTRGTMIDCVADIVHGRDVVIVEGVADALTARLAYPNAVILGANGAGNIRKIADVAVPRIKLARTRLFLVPHDDDAGIRAMTKAAQVAMGAGLQLDLQLFIVELPSKDLNAAWLEGWRPLVKFDGGQP